VKYWCLVGVSLEYIIVHYVGLSGDEKGTENAAGEQDRISSDKLNG
jgi:hypothetical protein